VSPTTLPVLVNGGFLQAKADRVRDPLAARALVLDDGDTRLAIVVVDSCMMPRDLLDRAKDVARTRTGIRIDRMLISATHTHSALAVAAVQSPEGRPIALLANYSMHYFGTSAVSADYFGRFARTVKTLVGAIDKEESPPFVGIMSQGTSGDQHWMDYSQPRKA